MKTIKLREVRYSPGYGDMLGGNHEMTLNLNGEGRMTCLDRETWDAPTVIAVYEVLPEAIAELEDFIVQKKVFSLEDRPKSDLFVTDYHPWGFWFEYETTSFGKTERNVCILTEYQNYSKKDYEVIDGLRERLSALRGRKISETAQEK